jgi:hypothetical protein
MLIFILRLSLFSLSITPSDTSYLFLSYHFFTITRKELFEGLAGLTLPIAIKTALELADRRLQKQEEKADKTKNNEKGKSKRDKDDDIDTAPTSFQSPTVSSRVE